MNEDSTGDVSALQHQIRLLKVRAWFYISSIACNICEITYILISLGGCNRRSSQFLNIRMSLGLYHLVSQLLKIRDKYRKVVFKDMCVTWM